RGAVAEGHAGSRSDSPSGHRRGLSGPRGGQVRDRPAFHPRGEQQRELTAHGGANLEGDSPKSQAWLRSHFQESACGGGGGHREARKARTSPRKTGRPGKEGLREGGCEVHLEYGELTCFSL